MTISIEQHIEELRAELRNAVYRDERRWMEAELAQAQAELEAAITAQDAGIEAEPPH
ncbi:hypothetical protein LB553_12730 [Mesorhizobium sp. CA8]|uniref:hypothetical protein n=1 Tax=unclassified Mesorhizobium TaxID=325217 RepID=UPI001CCE5D42|nr:MULTISPECIES: hypothetical protein [unclassified Mesorhizobium]MBZ9761732.1 hypothetical protein [Mesorhizobium sp. CA8]MBZ9820515.1 hypothetical protein [Mesorhizobium sp. CA4]